MKEKSRPIRFHLYEVPRILRFRETEEGMMAARGWEEGNGELVFRGCEISVWEDEKVLEEDGAGGCTTI